MIGAPTARGRKPYGIDCDAQNQKRAMLNNLVNHSSVGGHRCEE